MTQTEQEGVAFTEEEFRELQQKLKAAEVENNKLARVLRSLEKRSAILQLNLDTQAGLNKTITLEKQKQDMYIKLLLYSCPDIMMVFDEHMTFLLGTESIKDIIDVDDISILHGRSLLAIVERYVPPVGEFTGELMDAAERLAAQSEETEIPLEILTITGYKYDVRMLRFNQENGDFAGVLIVMHDITALSDAKEQAEKASSSKSEFLSRMSHEMRTPLNAIIGMTSIARNADEMEKKDYCLEKIDGASKHLLGVINDVLDMSKIEANKLELSSHLFNFENMLINVTNVLNFRIEEKNQIFNVTLDKKTPLMVMGDELRLTQVITNLLTNAVKFTPEGGTITLNIQILEDDEDSHHILFEVFDTGIGISQEQQDRLFTAFEQAEGGTARKFGGTWLGLAISKRIVELMGGHIWIESELGRGAKFAFIVRLKKSDEQRSLRRVSRDGIRILAVDDSIEVRDFFMDVTERYGLSCDVAANGTDAIRLIKKNAETNPYNIFFVDWIMPGMNGIELVKSIKEMTQENSVITMISSAEWNRISDAGKEAGVDRFISKPLFPSSLLNVIEDCISRPESQAEEDEIQGMENFEGIRLLVAEDVEINREIVAGMLEDTKIKIDFAENGKKAVEMFETSPGKYNLILMDVQMPEMDGYDATRRIREVDRREAAIIPIIAMTANVFKEDVEACLTAGMNGHLGKPLDYPDLLKVFRQFLAAN